MWITTGSEERGSGLFDTKNAMKNIKERENIRLLTGVIMKYVLIGCGRIATNHMRAAVNNNWISPQYAIFYRKAWRNCSKNTICRTRI
jgi:hypothetical protein